MSKRAVAHRLRDLVRVHGEIGALGAVGAHVDHLVTGGHQLVDQAPLSDRIRRDRSQTRSASARLLENRPQGYQMRCRRPPGKPPARATRAAQSAAMRSSTSRPEPPPLSGSGARLPARGRRSTTVDARSREPASPSAAPAKATEQCASTGGIDLGQGGGVLLAREVGAGRSERHPQRGQQTREAPDGRAPGHPGSRPCPRGRGGARWWSPRRCTDRAAAPPALSPPTGSRSGKGRLDRFHRGEQHGDRLLRRPALGREQSRAPPPASPTGPRGRTPCR